ncbi:MAG: hypothetical protein WC705_00965 [Candidatus Paceibacterota bacterium]|jgi:hypothetical protein
MKLLNNKKGVAALSAILIMGAIVVEAAIASLVASYFLNQQGLGVRLSRNASMAAKAGINDAILKVLWDKDFPSGSYSLTLDNASTAIQITRDISGRYDISSEAVAVDKRSKFEAILQADNNSGFVNIDSIEEVSVN